jgi:hypothetical protein
MSQAIRALTELFQVEATFDREYLDLRDFWARAGESARATIR